MTLSTALQTLQPYLPRPTLLDRAIGYVSPAHAVRRIQARTLLNLAGQYVGGRSDRRATQGWMPTIGSPDGDVGKPTTLRARSRDLARNAPIATGIIRILSENVVGWGLEPQPRLDREILRLSDEAARSWERMAKRLWWSWSLFPCSDHADRLPFPRQLELIGKSEDLSGDVWVIRHFDERRRRRTGGLFATRIQVLEADRVSNPDGKSDSEELVDGVQLNPRTGERLGIWVSARHPGEHLGTPLGPWTWIPMRGTASGSPQVLHVMDTQGRPGLTRGVTLLAPVIETLRQVSQLSDAQLTLTLVSTLFSAFIETTGEAGSGLSGIPGLVGAQPSGATLEQKNQIKLAPAGVWELNPGEKITFADPPHPNADFAGFFDSFITLIAIGVGIPEEVIRKRFTASFSASKGALQEFWRSVRTRRQRLIESVADPAYAWIVEEAVLRGYLDAPGFFDDPLLRMAYTTATWTGPSPGHLNPLQEANAMRVRMETRVTTLEEEIAQYSGRDWEETLQQAANEQRTLRDLGLTASFDPESAFDEPEAPDAVDREEAFA